MSQISSTVRSILAAGGVALVAATAAVAGDVVLYRQGQTPNPRDIAKILSAPAKQPGVKMRGMKPMGSDTDDVMQGGAVVAQTPPQAVAPEQADGATSFALNIQFPFNSAQIQPDMVEPLDAVAEGIKMSGGGRIVIEGHTDAVGAVDYNIMLSKRRSGAVRDYFVQRHGIPTGMFQVVGKGKSDPLIRENPFAAENRRVQFKPAM